MPRSESQQVLEGLASQKKFLAQLSVKFTKLHAQLMARFDRLEAAGAQSKRREVKMEAALAKLKADVARNSDVSQSAVLLIKGIAARIDAAKGDPSALMALSASLNADVDALAAAVAENTPAAEVPA